MVCKNLPEKSWLYDELSLTEQILTHSIVGGALMEAVESDSYDLLAASCSRHEPVCITGGEDLLMVVIDVPGLQVVVVVDL